MDILKPYTLAHSAYLALQSLPLVFTPSLILSLLNTSDPRRITDLETYFARALAFALLAFAGVCLILTDTIPVGKKSVSWADENAPVGVLVDGGGKKSSEYAKATVVVMTTYHAISSFHLYTQQFSYTYRPASNSYSTSWNFGFSAGLVISGAMFCVGVWVLLFGGDKGRLSKSTGADKRTGNFPFVNVESSKEIKKERKREKEREKESDSKRRSLGGRTKSRDA